MLELEHGAGLELGVQRGPGEVGFGHREVDQLVAGGVEGCCRGAQPGGAVGALGLAQERGRASAADSADSMADGSLSGRWGLGWGHAPA